MHIMCEIRHNLTDSWARLSSYRSTFLNIIYVVSFVHMVHLYLPLGSGTGTVGCSCLPLWILIVAHCKDNYFLWHNASCCSFQKATSINNLQQKKNRKTRCLNYLQDFDENLDVDPSDPQRESKHGRQHDEKQHHKNPYLENTYSHTPEVIHHHCQLRQPQLFNTEVTSSSVGDQHQSHQLSFLSEYIVSL